MAEPATNEPADKKDDQNVGDPNADKGATGAEGTGDQKKPEEYTPHAWQAQLAGDNKKDPFGKDFPTINDLFEGFKKVQSKLGEGVPTKAEEYDLPDPPEGVEIDPETKAWFQNLALSVKLKKEDASALYAEWNKRIAELQKDQTARAEENKANLIKHYGGEDKLNTALTEARDALFKFAPDSLLDYLDETGPMNHPDLILMLAEVGKAVSQDRIVTGGGSNETTPENPMDAIYPSMKGMKPQGAPAQGSTKGIYASMEK